MSDPEMELWQKEWSKTIGGLATPLPNETVAAAARHQRRSNLTLAVNIALCNRSTRRQFDDGEVNA